MVVSDKRIKPAGVYRAQVGQFVQTLKNECLDKFEIVAGRHLNHICCVWIQHCICSTPLS